MSAKDRAERAHNADNRRRRAAEAEGIRQALGTPDGRALISWLIRTGLEAEGKGSKQLRQFGRDILRTAALADFEALQIMREEWEKPKLWTRAEAEEPEGEE